MYAQDEIFKVLASSGSNKVQAQGATDWKPLFFGKKLLKGDKIIIADKGYLGLVFKNGKSIEIKKPGTYEVSKLAAEVAKQNASVNTKYTDFLAGEMGKTKRRYGQKSLQIYGCNRFRKKRRRFDPGICGFYNQCSESSWKRSIDQMGARSSY